MSVNYIIGHRGLNSRKRNLFAVVKHIMSFSIPVFVIEQDISPFNQKELESMGCSYLHIYNNGLYNRSWAFNVAFKQTVDDILICADNDMILEKETIFKSIEMVSQYDAVKPFSNLYDLSEAQTVNFLNTSKIIHGSIGRGGMNFSSGICVMKRNLLEKIGGWDERFRGWGGEDDAMTLQLKYNNCKIIQLDHKCYHLNHERSVNDGTQFHEHYKDNLKILNEVYASGYKNKLDEIGNKNKYR